MDGDHALLVMPAARENRSVRETEALRPALRADLRFSIQEQRGNRSCVIEDPAASRFHRVGLGEYCFLRSLDGSCTVASLLARHARAAGGEAFSEAEAMQILQWARENLLLTLEAPAGPNAREHQQRALQAAATWLNPLSIRIPMGRPDRFFAVAARALAPAFGWAGLLVWLAVLLAGAAHLAPEWAQFTKESGGILARDNWFWIFLGWAVLKIVHECGHGVVCRHFGAPVREVGVIFILGLPMGYVDATSSLGLASRWKRIAVAAAGMGAEFFLAALAAIVWVRSSPGSLHTLAHNMVITGTVVTLFFNANPLMRYDGYFILSDLLAVPNLSTRGRHWHQRALAWLLLGARSWQPRRPVTWEEWLVAGYGVAAWAWGGVVTAGLIMAASVVLRGGGLIFAVAAALSWVALPVARFGAQLRGAVSSGAASGRALALRLGGLAGAAAALLLVPWHSSVSSVGVVEMPETEILRAECAGFITEVLVHDGERVSAGQTLMTLRNEEAASELEKTRLELAQQGLKARLAYTRQDVATWQAETAKADSLQKSVAEQEDYLRTLIVKAPFAGCVTNRHFAQLAGQWMRNGDELLRLGKAAGSELKIAVNERQEPHFRAALGAPLEVRVEGRALALAARLTRVDGHATREMAWPALTALAGGPIALRHSEKADKDEKTSEYELAEPHFTATAWIEEAAGLLPGETARVRFHSTRRDSLWEEMQGGLGRWMQRYASR